MHRGWPLALALALIGGPIVCGAIFFLADAPPQLPGAYVEIADGIHPLSTCVPAAPPGDVSTTAEVVRADVRSFFLVLADSVSAPANVESARLYLKVVNHAEPEVDYGRVPLATAIHRMHERVYRVTSDQELRWDSRGLTNSLYQQALSRLPGNRATTELLVELDVPAPPAGSCRYAVTLGPPPALRDLDVRWFVPPTEKRP